MKRAFIILTLLLLSFSSHAKYDPLQLYEMIIKAEKIVYGTIVELDSSHFTLKIEGSLTSDKGTLKIVRFRNWTCAARWTDYKVGQRLFLFLRTYNNQLVSMSGGNEGELPIVGDSVYIDGFSVPVPLPTPPPGVTLEKDLIYFETEYFNIYGGNYRGIQWDLDSFIKSVSFIRNCFDITYGEYWEITDWQINCEKSELEQMSKESKLVKWVNYEANH